MRYLIAILLLSFGLVGCQKEVRNTPVEVFETLWHDFNNHYPIFKERGIDWDQLYNIYRPQVSNDISQDSLWNILSNLLFHTRDGHVVLNNPHQNGLNSLIAGNYKNDYPINFYNPSAVNATLPTPTKNINEYLSWGAIPEYSIGYIHIKSFHYNHYNIQDLDKLVEKVAEYNAIIIDIRDNLGGHRDYCFRLSSWFTSQNNLVFSAQEKSGTSRDDFSPLTPFHNYMQPNNYPDKQIAILTNHKTVSTAEIFTLAAKGFSSQIQIGGTTGGFLSVIGNWRFLPNGWRYYYPVERVLLPDGSCLEGVGCAPDIHIVNSDFTESQYKDNVLDGAIDYLIKLQNSENR